MNDIRLAIAVVLLVAGLIVYLIQRIIKYNKSKSELGPYVQEFIRLMQYAFTPSICPRCGRYIESVEICSSDKYIEVHHN